MVPVGQEVEVVEPLMGEQTWVVSPLGIGFLVRQTDGVQSVLAK